MISRTKQLVLYLPRALGRSLVPLKPGCESAFCSSSRFIIPVELLLGLAVTSLDILFSIALDTLLLPGQEQFHSIDGLDLLRSVLETGRANKKLPCPF